MKISADTVAVVTGAGSGIGRALALALAKQKCALALVDIRTEDLADTQAQVEGLGSRCTIHEVDVASRESMETLATAVVDAHGSVALLFNNAGVTLVDEVTSVTFEDFEWLMNINFWGVVYGTKAFLPYLLQAKSAHIVNISSLFGLMGFPGQAAYNASKFAVRGFSEALKMELAHTSVGVSCVHPGGIKTDIVRNAKVGHLPGDVSSGELADEFDRIARTTPAKAAQTILRGVRKGKRRILVGTDARVMDWVVRHFPGSYETLLRLEARFQKVRQL